MADLAYPLVVVLGPTASGKSELALALAREFDGEIIACDSTQVYRGFDIGTAKLRPDERQGIPHHLVDLLEPGELFTAGDYRRAAAAKLEELRGRAKLPIVVAGTGLYLRALLDGLFEGPRRDEAIRERLGRRAEQKGTPRLHRLLRRLDPVAAERIAPRDTPKIIRAIEVCLLARRPISELHRRGRRPLEGFSPVKVGLMPSRPALYERIEERVERMVAAGLEEEVRQALARGVEPEAKPFQFIGYAEMLRYVRGEFDHREAIARIKRETRHYAKRQITWFRKEPGVAWFHGFGDDAGVREAVARFLRGELATRSVPFETRQKSL